MDCYLEGFRPAPKAMRVVTLVDSDGEHIFRLLQSAPATLMPPAGLGMSVRQVAHAVLLGHLSTYALYEVDGGAEFLAVECDEFFGETLHLAPTLSQMVADCKTLQATFGLANAMLAEEALA